MSTSMIRITSKTNEGSSSPKLSVVVCTTPGRIEFLASLLSNILKQDYHPFEVIIVTDAGYSNLIASGIPDEVCSLLRIRVVESGGHGLSKARNRGVEASIGDIILFLDDDIILPHPNILFRVVEAFEENEKLGVYGVQVKPILYNSVYLGDKYNWIYGCTDNNAVRPVGAFFAVRRECFNTVGLFSENLGRFGRYLLSGEETEFFSRVQKYMGLKVVLDNSVKVYHIIHGRGWKYILKRSFMEGVSKGRFTSYNYSVEKSYLKRYLKDFPIGWLIIGMASLGFIYGKLR